MWGFGFEKLERRIGKFRRLSFLQICFSLLCFGSVWVVSGC